MRKQKFPLDEKLKRVKLSKNDLKKTPEENGVYIFWQSKNTPLYIGKSLNLKRRINSYLSSSLLQRTKKMISEANYFSYVLVLSELEALLLEAKLVRIYQPRYNSQLKDDKNPLYIRITKEKYPRVLTARKIDEEKKNIAFFGPFPSSRNVISVLKMLRRIFPYSQHKLGKRACLYSQIGLCDPCPNSVESLDNSDLKTELRKNYLKNIRSINSILSGKLKIIRSNLERRMKKLSKAHKYEKAKVVRDQIRIIDYITQPITPVDYFLKNPSLLETIRRKELDDFKILIKDAKYAPKRIKRIECFDIAHMSGEHPTASMVTFIGGDADKNYYRHFRIRQKKGADDISSMKEVAKRRVKYLSSWGIPDLIIVDGGKAQVSVFDYFFADKKLCVIGTAKRSESLIIIPANSKERFIRIKLARRPALNLIKRIRNEAHRFARRYHHKLLYKELLASGK
jgi:excinuclease ABC subunit C